MYRPDDETVPPVAVQVTAVLLEPETVEVNCCVVPVRMVAVVGVIDTETAVTVTVTDADFDVSAVLVAFTV